MSIAKKPMLTMTKNSMTNKNDIALESDLFLINGLINAEFTGYLFHFNYVEQ